MTKIRVYQYDKQSVLDIKMYLEGQGYQTDFKYDPDNLKHSLIIHGSRVSVDVPSSEKINLGPMPSIRFDNYPKGKNDEVDEKIYRKLCNKFKSKEPNDKVYIQEVKDWDKIEPIINKNGSFLGIIKRKLTIK